MVFASKVNLERVYGPCSLLGLHEDMVDSPKFMAHRALEVELYNLHNTFGFDQEPPRFMMPDTAGHGLRHPGRRAVRSSEPPCPSNTKR